MRSTAFELDKKDALLAAALAAAAAAVYLAALSRDYVFEGLFWAMPIDLGFYRRLCPGNYILYGPMGAAFHALAGLAGFSGLAIDSLQIMDALLGAAGLCLFYATLRELGARRGAALAWAAVLGSSLAYWRWSTDAESYILSALLLQLEFFFCVRYARGQASPYLLGALQALAVTGHIVNSVFAAVPLWFIVAAPRGREGGGNARGAGRRSAAAFLATAASLSLAAYGAVLGFLVRPASPARAWHWFLGSADTRAGAVHWHGGVGLGGVGRWLRMTVHIFTSFQPEFASPPGWRGAGAFLWIARLLLAACAAVSIARARRLRGLRRTAAIGCALWLGAYACVFTSWEPDTMVYRVGDLAPLCALLWLGWGEAAGGVFALLLPSVLAAALAVGNFTAEVRPRSFDANNPDLARMAFLKSATRAGDWIAGQGGRDELYIPYFAQRRPLIVDLFRDDPQALSRRIAGALETGQGVFVTSRILADPGWRRFFGRFRPREEGRSADGFALYRLAPAAGGPGGAKS